MEGYDLRIQNQVARITFNRPHLKNAVTPEIMIALNEDLKAIAANKDVRVVVFAGEGDCLSSGADISYFRGVMSLPEGERVAAMTKDAGPAHEWIATVDRMPQPVVATVRGAVGGSGMAIVCVADFVIASDNSFFTVSHVKIGGTVDGGSTYYLPRLIGVRAAKRLCMLGDRFKAQEAYDLGLVTQLVPDSELEAAVEALVERLRTSASLAVSGTKQLINVSFDHDVEEQLALEVESWGRGAGTVDFNEGTAAFLEKRTPAFSGN